MTLCLLGVLQGPTTEKTQQSKQLKFPLPFGWGGSCIKASFSPVLTGLCGALMNVCTACDHGQSLLLAGSGDTEPQHPHISWAGTGQAPQVLKTTAFSYLLKREKTAHRISVLFNLGQSRRGSGLGHAVCLGMQLKMCSWVEWATGRYSLLQEHHRSEAGPYPAWVNPSGIPNTPKARLEQIGYRYSSSPSAFCFRHGNSLILTVFPLKKTLQC